MSSPSPGWYPDPTSPGNLRFFDGESWTKSVVPVPADGQLSPDMIAAGRRIMQAKAASKFSGAFVPSSLTDSQAQSLTSAVDTKAKRRTLDGAMDPTAGSSATGAKATVVASARTAQDVPRSNQSAAPTAPAQQSSLTSGSVVGRQDHSRLAEPDVSSHTGLASSSNVESQQTATKPSETKPSETNPSETKQSGANESAGGLSWTSRFARSAKDATADTPTIAATQSSAEANSPSRWAPQTAAPSPGVTSQGVTTPAASPESANPSGFSTNISGVKTSAAREEHTSANSPVAQAATPIRRTGLSIPLPGRKKQTNPDSESPDSAQPSWMQTLQDDNQDASSFSATAGAQEQESPKDTGLSALWGRIKSSRIAWGLIAAFVVVVVVLVVVQLQSGNTQPAKGFSDDYKSLGLKQTFDCSALGAEVMTLSQSTPGEIPIDDLENPKMSKDMRGSFKLPEKNGEFNDAFECEAVAQYSDGESKTIKYNISADKNKKFWTKYDQRSE